MDNKPRKPIKPYGSAPQKPRKYVPGDERISVIVPEYNCGQYSNLDIPLVDIIDNLPEGLKPEDVFVRINCRGEVEYGYYDESYGQAIIENVSLHSYKNEAVPDEQYAKLMKAYEDDVRTYEMKQRKYNKKLEQYNKDMEIWNKANKK